MDTSFALAVTKPLPKPSFWVSSLLDGDFAISFPGLLISMCPRFVPKPFPWALSSSSTFKNAEAPWPLGWLWYEWAFSTITQSSELLLFECIELLYELLSFPYKDINFDCVRTLDALKLNWSCLPNWSTWDKAKKILVKFHPILCHNIQVQCLMERSEQRF